MNKKLKQIIAVFVAVLLPFQGLGVAPAFSQSVFMPSSAFSPAVLRGIKVDPKNPFHFNFVLDQGQTKLDGQELKDEGRKLIKYFLTSLTLPENDLWVNLSPYEKDRIIVDQFGQTEMGRQLLSEDYLLKKLSTSLLHPDTESGKKFWEKVRKTAGANIPIETFNRIWIMPDKAVVYQDKGAAFIGETHLKVLLEEDYKSLTQAKKTAVADTASTSIFRQEILPIIEKEVNEGENFASLRQIYHSLILASWYKRTLKQSVLSQVYVDQKKIVGIESNDKDAKQKIYDEYLTTFKKGVYNLIREEADAATGEMIPHKYFSGGVTLLVSSSAIQTRPLTASSPIPSVGKLAIFDIAAQGLNASLATKTDEISVKFDDLIVNSELKEFLTDVAKALGENERRLGVQIAEKTMNVKMLPEGIKSHKAQFYVISWGDKKYVLKLANAPILFSYIDRHWSALKAIHEPNRDPDIVYPVLRGLIGGQKWKDSWLEGRAFMVMEYVPHRDLYDVTEQNGVYSKQDALDFFLKLSRVISRLHKKGIVVADLNLSNILIKSDGDPVLLDFDVSAIKDKPALDGLSSQVQADIKSLGEALFYSMTGKKVNSVGGLLAEFDDAPIRDIILRSISDETTQQFASVDEMMAALQKARDQSSASSGVGSLTIPLKYSSGEISVQFKNVIDSFSNEDQDDRAIARSEIEYLQAIVSKILEHEIAEGAGIEAGNEISVESLAVSNGHRVFVVSWGEKKYAVKRAKGELYNNFIKNDWNILNKLNSVAGKRRSDIVRSLLYGEEPLSRVAGDSRPLTAYLVTEYLQGLDLSEEIKHPRGPLNLSQVVQLGISLSEAVEYVNGQGIIIRDINPPNIKMLEGGRIALYDFDVSILPDYDWDKDEYEFKYTAINGWNVEDRDTAPEDRIRPKVQTDVFSIGMTLLRAAIPTFYWAENINLDQALSDVEKVNPELKRIIAKAVSPRWTRYKNAAELKADLLTLQANLDDKLSASSGVDLPIQKLDFQSTIIPVSHRDAGFSVSSYPFIKDKLKITAENPRFLFIGGTANEIAPFLENYPTAQISIVTLEERSLNATQEFFRGKPEAARIRLYQGDASTLDPVLFPNESFDLIYANNVDDSAFYGNSLAESVEILKRMAREEVRLLRLNGVLFHNDHSVRFIDKNGTTIIKEYFPEALTQGILNDEPLEQDAGWALHRKVKSASSGVNVTFSLGFKDDIELKENLTIIANELSAELEKFEVGPLSAQVSISEIATNSWKSGLFLLKWADKKYVIKLSGALYLNDYIDRHWEVLQEIHRDQVDPDVARPFLWGNGEKLLGRMSNLHYLVMEYVPGKDLLSGGEETQSWRGKEAVELILKIASIVSRLHSKQIVVADIYPYNIRLRQQDGEPALYDFDTSMTKDMPRTGQNNPTFQGDIAQLGTVLFFLLSRAYISAEELKNNQEYLQGVRNQSFRTIIEKAINQQYEKIEDFIADLEKARVELSSQTASSAINKEEVGGIDLREENLNLDLRGPAPVFGGEAGTFELPSDPAKIQNIRIDGLVPVILSVTPLPSIPAFLKLSAAELAEPAQISLQK